MTLRQGFTPIPIGGRGIGKQISATVLVSQQGFGVRYDLDQATGVISNRDHDLYGESVAGHILVFTQPKGGRGGLLVAGGIAPAGMIFRQASPIFVQGAIFAGIALLDSLSDDPCATLQTGELVILQPEEGCVRAKR